MNEVIRTRRNMSAPGMDSIAISLIKLEKENPKKLETYYRLF
jgi:hypothetical protein